MAIKIAAILKSKLFNKYKKVTNLIRIVAVVKIVANLAFRLALRYEKKKECKLAENNSTIVNHRYSVGMMWSTTPKALIRYKSIAIIEIIAVNATIEIVNNCFSL